MRDAARDALLDEAEIRTMRIPTVEVLRDLQPVLLGIIDQAQARLPLHHPARPDGPPPRDKLGEDL
jgi:very-short-patch-repair endonuclease